MAISTVAGINAAIAAGKSYKTSWLKTTTGAAYTAGRWYNTYMMAGQPGWSGAAAYQGTQFTSYQLVGSGATPCPGKISIGENVSPDVRHLVNIEMATIVALGVPSWLMLVDQLLYYPVNLQVTNQAMTNSVSLPRYTDGIGVRMFLEITATQGAAASNLNSATFLYTNSADVANRTIPGTVTTTGAAIVPHITHSGVALNNFGPFIPLAAGDLGVKSVQNFGLNVGDGGTGTAALVLCKPLATIPLVAINTATSRDYVFNIPSMPVVQDGACLSFLLCPGGAVNATSFFGTLDFVWG